MKQLGTQLGRELGARDRKGDDLERSTRRPRRREMSALAPTYPNSDYRNAEARRPLAQSTGFDPETLYTALARSSRKAPWRRLPLTGELAPWRSKNRPSTRLLVGVSPAKSQLK